MVTRGSVALPRPVVWLTTASTPRERWLQVRRQGVGGSDVAAILGRSRFRTAWQVWAEKTGLIEADEPGERAMWGHLLEDVVAKRWAHVNGASVRRCGMVADPVHPHRMASLDRAVIVPGTTRATALLEVKTTSDRAARLSDDELADRYRLQVQWYLGVTGLPVARLAVLVGGQELRDFHVNAEPADYQELCDAVDGFWHGHVMAGVAPDLVPADADATRAIPADPDAPPAVASDELLGFIEARRVALERAKLYTAEAKYVQGVIQAAMGEATELVAPDGQRLFTWRPVRTTTTNWEALLKDHPEVAELAAGYRTTTTSRRLSPVKPKDEDA